jgi:hypothetical protein
MQQKYSDGGPGAVPNAGDSIITGSWHTTLNNNITHTSPASHTTELRSLQAASLAGLRSPLEGWTFLMGCRLWFLTKVGWNLGGCIHFAYTDWPKRKWKGGGGIFQERPVHDTILTLLDVMRQGRGWKEGRISEDKGCSLTSRRHRIVNISIQSDLIYLRSSLTQVGL